MQQLIKNIYRKIIPNYIRNGINIHRQPSYLKKLRKDIITYYSKLDKVDLNIELSEVLAYLKKNPVQVFPYSYISNYHPDKTEVFFDDRLSLSYVFLDGKRLYLKRSWTEKVIKNFYCAMQIEQDFNSPHQYFSESFYVENGDIVVDVGTAEGNFSLSIIDKASKIYLFETDKEWIEALEATFEPWKEKVEIINKFVSKENDEKNITLDTFFKNKEQINFLKIDVDGAEADLLKGGEEILNLQKSIKIALCTYHKQNDEKEFTLLLKNKGFNVSPSKGYMIFYTNIDEMKEPFLRKGLIRAEK